MQCLPLGEPSEDNTYLMSHGMILHVPVLDSGFLLVQGLGVGGRL